MRPLALFALGLIAGITIIVACSDDAPPPADAGGTDGGACNCPAAEPPLAGRLTRRASDPETFEPGELSGFVSASCVGAEIALSGSCNGDAGLTLFRAGGGEGDWTCIFRNDDVNPHNATATVLCLAQPE